MPANRPIPTIVFDAFGTLLKIDTPTRPFSLLAQHLQDQGANVSDFASRAMTAPHTPSSLAASYGVPVSVGFLAHIDALLLSELERIEPYGDADRVLRHVLGRGASVVIASNLAWPYALPVRSMVKRMINDLGSHPRVRLSTFFSFQQGLLKPDPWFYQKLASSLPANDDGSRPSICMVGDKLIEDVNAPFQAGWRAWHLHRPGGATLFDAPWDEWLERGA